MSHVLAIDQGTSSSRAIIFDPAGAIVAAAQQPFDQSYPADGLVEQDAEDIWRTTLDAVRQALAAAAAGGVETRDIAALGIANQRETTVLWDADTGAAVHPAIVWQDRRTAQRCDAMRKDGVEDVIRDITGLLIDPYFSSTKLAWLLDQPGIRRKAEAGRLRFGTVDSFLIWRLTNGQKHCTDATNASRTQLYDIARHAWSDTLLDYFGVPAAVLPEVKDSVDDFGISDPAHFGVALPIRGVAGDQQAALVGQGCLEPGMTKSTYGTGCFLMTNTGDDRIASKARLLTTVGYRIDGKTAFALEGSIFSAGAAIKWLRDRLGLIGTAAESEVLARRIEGETRGVYVVPAFTGLGAPQWRPDARGLITGLTLDDGREEIVAATLKSVGFQTADLIRAVEDDGVAAGTLRVDGGMVANDWFCPVSRRRDRSPHRTTGGDGNHGLRSGAPGRARRRADRRPGRSIRRVAARGAFRRQRFARAKRGMARRMAPRRSPRSRMRAYNYCRPDGRSHLRQAMLRAALLASVALATLLGNPCFAQTTMREMIEAIRDDARRTEDYTGVAELDARVIDAMSRVERDKFVPWAAKIAAYVNRPLPIGHGQTISQPFIVALMTHLLQPREGDRVLEIGTGSGYQAARARRTGRGGLHHRDHPRTGGIRRQTPSRSRLRQRPRQDRGRLVRLAGGGALRRHHGHRCRRRCAR